MEERAGENISREMIFSKIEDTVLSTNFKVGKWKIMQYERFIMLVICILA